MATYRVAQSWWTETEVHAASWEEAVEIVKEFHSEWDDIYGGDIEHVEKVED